MKRVQAWDILRKKAAAPSLDLLRQTRVIAVAGAGEFLAEKVVAWARAHWSAQADVSVSAHEAQALGRDEFLQMLDTAPLFEAKPVYFLRRAEKKVELARWLGDLEGPKAVKNHMLLQFTGKELKADVVKQLDRLGAVAVDCPAIPSWETAKALHWLAEDMGLPLEPAAAELLTATQGQDLAKAENELRKVALILGAPPSRPLSASQLAPHLGLLREEHVFAITDLLLRDKAAEADIAVRQLLAQGEKGLVIVGVLASFLRKCLLAQDMKRAGRPEKDIYARLGLPPTIARQYVAYASRRDGAAFTAALRLCQKADLALKSTPIGEDLLISEVIAQLS